MSEAFEGAKGQLRETLGAKKGEAIPVGKLRTAAGGKRRRRGSVRSSR